MELRVEYGGPREVLYDYIKTVLVKRDAYGRGHPRHPGSLRPAAP
ncbi:hypothetical protein [Microvirga aerilata]|nr:hypothetical protein [Microvirga aerilata]